MKITELIARISADTSGFGPAVGVAVGDLGKLETKAQTASTSLEKMDRTGRTVGSGFENLSRQFSSITSAFGFSLGVTGIVQLGTQAIDSAAKMDSLRRGMVAVTGSAGAAAIEIGKLEETAKLPGLGFEQAIQGSINLQAAGFSASLSRAAIEGFGNALATVGKGKTELDGVIVALSQIAAKGKVSAEEINQIAERLPQIRKIMQSAFGTADTEALQKMGISSQVFIERIVAELGKLPRATGGLKNDLENTSDQWRKTLADMGDAIAPLVVATTSGTQKAAQGITDAVAIVMQKYDELKDYGTRWLRDAGPKWQLIVAMLGVMNGGMQAKLVEGALGSGSGSSGSPGGTTPPPQKSSPSSPLVTGPTPDQIKQQREALERQIKGIYEAWDRYDRRLKDELDWRTKISQEMVKLDEEEWRAKTDWRLKTAQAIDEAKQKSLEIVPVTVSVTDIIRDAWQNTSRDSGEAIVGQVEGVKRLRDAYHAFGLTLASDTEIELDSLRGKLEVLEADVWKHAESTQALAAAYEALAKAQKQIRDKERSLEGKGPVPEAKDAEKIKIDPAQTRILREVSTIITDTSRNITDLIFKGGKFKDVMVNAAEEIGKALVRNVIQMGLEKIIGLIGKITAQIPGIGGALGKLGGIFGGGSSAASGAATAAGGAASAGGAAASSVASAASGWITAGASVVSAISGIVFGIKAAKDADVVNKHTLQLVMQGEVMRTLVDSRLTAIHDRLMEFRTHGVGVWPQPDYDWALAGSGGSGGGGVTVNQNIYGNQIYGARGMEMLAQDLARLIKGYL